MLSRSPLKTVAPTEAGAVPTWARSAKMMVPSEDEGVAQRGEIKRVIESSVETKLFVIAEQSSTRGRAINASKRATERILSQNRRVNQETAQCRKKSRPFWAGLSAGRHGHPLIQCTPTMADWKQITARIRRARTGKDPAGQLSNLFEKTHDAMVAFELAKFFENAGQAADAAKWYAAAAERFRRADWKTKAQEAAARLGGAAGPTLSEMPAADFELTPPAAPPQEQALPFEQNAEALESAVAVSSEIQQAAEPGPSAPLEAGRKRRRRGRRGGRNRRRAAAPTPTAGLPAEHSRESAASRHELPPVEIQESAEPAPPRIVHGRAIPSLPVEAVGEPGGVSIKGRYGDPGLSSRISLLEMQFRRLLNCSPAKLSEADRAPAGPGVFVLTDSDLTSYYYVEACQTLRIAIANLVRGGSRRGTESIKPRLAEHLGIPETRVGKYLAEHCVVRWLQLDEGASNFAHFAIAVLRPVLNE